MRPQFMWEISSVYLQKMGLLANPTLSNCSHRLCWSPRERTELSQGGIVPTTTSPSCHPLGRAETGLTAKLGLIGKGQWISNKRAVYQSSSEQLEADLYQHVDELLETCRILYFWWALARWAGLDDIIPAEFYTFTPSLHYSHFLSKKIWKCQEFVPWPIWNF